MSIVKKGRGRPLTLFAPGGQGENLTHRMRFADSVKGTKVGFVYEHSPQFTQVAKIRRQADRDAAEVRALAADYGTTRAIGFSRGARAVVGAIALVPSLFERIALVIPPANLRVAQNYETWLNSLSPTEASSLAAEILVVGQRGDRGHPADVAEAWANQLGAKLELLAPGDLSANPELVIDLLAEFFN